VAIGVFSHRMACKQPKTPAHVRRWTLADCIFILLFCVFFQFVLSPMIASAIRGLPMLSQHRMSGILLLYLAVFALPLAFVLPVYTRVKFKRTFSEFWFRSLVPFRDILSGIVWFSAYLGGLLVVSWLLVAAVLPELPHSNLSLMERIYPQQALFFRTAQNLLAGLGTWNWLLFGVVLGILVPVLEEAFFRGCLLNAFKDRWGPRVALVGSAAAFGILHLTPLLFPIFFLLGILTGLLYERTGNLLAPVTFHCLNNLTSLTILSMLL
jgi:membrane protease YdiL (CAAX protease family)